MAGGLGGKTRAQIFRPLLSAFGEGEGGIRAERQRGDIPEVLTQEADVGELAVVEAGERGERATMVCDPHRPGCEVEGETAEAYESLHLIVLRGKRWRRYGVATGLATRKDR